MPQPVFRYIPDRDLIQRLILRASNIKDDLDLAEFDLNEEDHNKDEEGVIGREEGENESPALVDNLEE